MTAQPWRDEGRQAGGMREEIHSGGSQGLQSQRDGNLSLGPASPAPRLDAMTEPALLPTPGLPENLVWLLNAFGDACEWAGRDHISDDAAGIPEARAALEAAIWAYGERAASEEVRERDRLFCKALIGSGIDTRDISKVLKVFNEIRPDRDEDFLKQMREFDANCAATLAALGAATPPALGRELTDEECEHIHGKAPCWEII